MKKIAFILSLLFMAFASQKELVNIITPRGGGDPLTENKEIVKKFYVAFRDNDAKGLNQLLAPNYKVQDSNVVFDSSYSKYDAFSKNLNTRLQAFHQALPNFKLTLIDMIAEDNKVMVRLQIQGVQRGPFLGILATDKSLVIQETVIFTLEGGKIMHINEIWNELGVMRQIGYIIL